MSKQTDPPFEQGKRRILDYVRDVMRGLDVEVNSLGYQWESDGAHSQLLLVVIRNGKRLILRFSETDVEAWSAPVARKYIDRILNVAGCLSRTPH